MHSKIPLYQAYHQSHTGSRPNYPGNSYKKQHTDVVQLVRKHGSASMLDYGCGKALQWRNTNLHSAWGFLPDLYDPAVAEFSTLPDRTYDAIISTDVFEHIPITELPGVIQWITSHATQFVFLGIADVPARAVLPNGENAHCTLLSHAEWCELIEQNHRGSCAVTVKTYPKERQSSVVHAPNTTTTDSI